MVYVGMVMIFLHTKRLMLSSKDSLVINIKPKVTCRQICIIVTKLVLLTVQKDFLNNFAHSVFHCSITTHCFRILL
jgi:hypothetical protein